jgi:hypothetical protein
MKKTSHNLYGRRDVHKNELCVTFIASIEKDKAN